MVTTKHTVLASSFGYFLVLFSKVVLTGQFLSNCDGCSFLGKHCFVFELFSFFGRVHRWGNDAAQACGLYFLSHSR